MEIRDAADVLGFERQWRDLARRASAHTMAQTFEWALTAVELDLAEKRQCYLVVVREGERWSAVMGLTLYRGFHRTLRPFSGGSHEEYSGPLLEAGRERVLADQILALATSIRADRLMLYNLTAGHATDLAAEALPLRQSVQPMQSYVLPAREIRDLGGGREAAFARRPEGPAPVRSPASGDRPGGRAFLRVAPLGRAIPRGPRFHFSREAPLAAQNQKNLPLARGGSRDRIFSNGSSAGSISINSPIVAEIRLGSKIVASAICLQSETSVNYFVNAFDDKYRKCSPTKVLIKYLIADALQNRRDFDFCVTLSEYKAEWPVEIKDCHTRKIYMTALGRAPTPGELTSAARKRLGGLRRRLSGQRAAKAV